MFYSHVYLRRNGRFGLVWLAATQSRILNKRELQAVNISITCSDILEHIPGSVGHGTYKRPRRFSLYLSSQLMYGSVKILQKQWECLLTDVSSLLRHFYPDISTTNEIDLVILRHDVVTIESCVPVSIKDKFYDPFFGAFKDSTVDVEALLEAWDTGYLEQCNQSITLPPSVTAEVGSPHSVSDPRDIQIQDDLYLPINPMMPGEQDLPMLDVDNLALLHQTDEDIQISAEEMMSPRISRILRPTEVTDMDIQTGPTRAFLEETPAVKTGGAMPSTPQKPKRKRPLQSPDGKKTLQREEETVMGSQQLEEQVVTHDDQLMLEPVVVGADGRLLSPVVPKGHDWLQKRPCILSEPADALTPSPARRRKPSRLIIDEKLQLHRSEIRSNMTTSHTTSLPFIIPVLQQKDLFKNPGSRYLTSMSLVNLWKRNCVLGLRAYDTESESSSSFTSPSLPEIIKRKRPSATAKGDTPEKQLKKDVSIPLSVERIRDTSARSAEGAERSHSIVGLSSDESSLSISARRSGMHAEWEKSGIDEPVLVDPAQNISLGVLPTLQEEHEQLLSPPALVQKDESFDVSIPLPHRVSPVLPEKPILGMVTEAVKASREAVTFRSLCPPATTSRFIAAKMFLDLCFEVGKAQLCIEQHQPYGDIFIWLPDQRAQ
ncbi:meiotic recombination protein REC8 homolog isoform X2 [Physella acuta]|uniref:meiotic recombination protein REC8 homolog isoform X2 n=1 Tax=Physella acuta TaxID=109671 RepID=UPI0027DB8D70|nr:meiotic recombination protein REC8 homolog isoform X2 [Physella acuta]